MEYAAEEGVRRNVSNGIVASQGEDRTFQRRSQDKRLWRPELDGRRGKKFRIATP